MRTRANRPHPSALAALSMLVSAALVLAGALVSTSVASAAPQASSRIGVSAAGSASTVDYTNDKRRTRGVPRLKRVKHLDKVARKQSRRMARTQRLHHNPNLASDIKNWAAYGENVAYASTVKQANQGLWRSAGHRANMLNRGFNQMGGAVVIDSDGRRWVTQVFRKKR